MTEIRNFFVDKYSRKISKTSKDCSEFLRTIDLPSLTSDEAGPCGNLLTNEEIWNALNEMQNNKSPGNDGLPSEFYVTFFNLLKIDLSDILYETNSKNIPGLLFAADFEGAFDSLDHVLIFETIRKFGFNDSFIRWIKLLHSNVKSCVVNNGFTTGYFTLNRGTRQGDPLAPYIFIMVMEILVAMVKQNPKIEGLTFDNKVIKQCLFADDVTYFLKNKESFSVLLETLSSFTEYSSLNVNLEKSEAAWIGPEKSQVILRDGIKGVNLTKEAVKILGIYFTYDRLLSQEYNFDRVIENLRIVLNMWKSRHLFILGKCTIINTLAIPKVLYVTSVLTEPTGFVDKIKKLLIDFLWHGKTPKIKYGVIIKEKQKGGLNFPDLQTKIFTQRIMLIRRLLETPNSSWKQIPRSYLRQIGGVRAVRTNFNEKCIPKLMCPFYCSCLRAWSKFTCVTPVTVNEIASQCLWNNSYIKSDPPRFFIDNMISHEILCVGHLFKEKGNIKLLHNIFDTSTESSMYQKCYFHWLKLIKSLPIFFTEIMKHSQNVINLNENMIYYGEKEHCLIGKLNSKLIYAVMVKKIHQESVAEKRFINLYENQANWNDVCEIVHCTAMDSYTRAFQYKIIHNILACNSKLKIWNVIDSPRCSYCFMENETLTHLFCECYKPITLYKQIQEWCKSLSINLPDMNPFNILYGIIPLNKQSILLNHLIMLYKITVYQARGNEKLLSLKNYQTKIVNIEQLEEYIAIKSNKVTKHEDKWNKIKIKLQQGGSCK